MERRCNVADFAGRKRWRHTPLIPSVPLHSSVRHLPLSQVDLSAKGLGEAKSAGSLLKSEGIKVDMAFTSYLKRGWVKGDTKQLLS